MREEQRASEERTLPSEGLSLLPTQPGRLKLLPRHGEPSCILEWGVQWLVKALAWAPLYTAVVVTLTLALIIFGVPFMEGR